MTDLTNIKFTANKAAQSRPDHYLDVNVNARAIIESWKSSLFSHEWLSPEGRIKDLKELPASEQSKRENVELALANAQEIAKPILGIGLLENVEIGSGKAEFLTLAALGLDKIPVHIPKSNESDFKDFICDVNLDA
ncbi:MAG: hypothetical protein ACLFR0_07065 [Alphaproteobacteria bacterium]